MTIVIAFHQSGYRDFKTYYIHFICLGLTNKFAELVNYTRMFELIQDILVPALLLPHSPSGKADRDCLCLFV
ncbi:Mobile element protein [Candidatus Enterovibrio escicola]|uniref:Mobile element protein n=1 Tax=Candidatus Enterovibrio escicola TaxID=1927127 RepID=A0A2A5T2K4_9GAMM|nr:hypothetical protein [Candidatus Enterovibrio escacola]PCS22392.1 Mobile element protein [Candidatus Enterovibrio escacola]